MPDPVTALATVGSTVLSSSAQRSAAKSAAGAQVQSAQMGIDEQRRQFDVMQELLSPYVSGGTQAFQAQRDLLGIGGGPGGRLKGTRVVGGAFGMGVPVPIFETAEEAQARALKELEEGPLFQAQVRQGEQALLQNAAATGQLRGGNLAAALVQFRPAMLQQQIQQQFANLGGLAQYGQASAARVGAGAQASGTNIANLLAQQGAAQAGGALAAGRATSQMLGLPAQIGGYAAGNPAFAAQLGNLFGGTQPAATTPGFSEAMYGGML
jgi:hypothetical protein